MKLTPIIPSIFSFELDVIKNDIEKLLKTREIKMIHFDGLNGLVELKYLLKKYDATADIHLFKSYYPLEDLDEVIKMDLSISLRVSAHIETGLDIKKFIDIAKKNMISPGLAIKLKTPISPDIFDYNCFKYFNLICNDEENGINLFQEEIFKKIELLQNSLKNKNIITLDCGIKEKHILPAIERGVANLVMGSAIFGNNNPLEAVRKFNKIANTIR